MTKYELLYIIPGTYADTELEKVQGDVAAVLEKAGGKISRTDVLGKIKLAYPVKTQSYGTYVLVHVDLKSAVLNDVNRALQLSELVLRHHILVLPKGAEKRKYQISAYVAPLSEESKKEKDSSPRKKDGTPAKSADVSPSMSIEDLDKKLDAILDKDITKDA